MGANCSAAAGFGQDDWELPACQPLRDNHPEPTVKTELINTDRRAVIITVLHAASPLQQG